jgi:hypothetical protein
MSLTWGQIHIFYLNMLCNALSLCHLLQILFYSAVRDVMLATTLVLYLTMRALDCMITSVYSCSVC